MSTLNPRVLKAKTLAELALIKDHDNRGRPSGIYVPGSKASRNYVMLRRVRGAITVQCNKDHGSMGMEPCLGNLNNVCYHCLTAIITAMSDAGYSPKFRSTFQDAEKVAEKYADIALSSGSGKPAIIQIIPKYMINENKSQSEIDEKSVWIVALESDLC